MYTTLPFNAVLDTPSYRGQRVETYKFELKNGVTNQTIRWVKPFRNQSAPTLSHDTTRSIKRQLQISLGADDAAVVNPLTDRIIPWMTVGGVTYPLGRFMFTDETKQISTGGDYGPYTLLDEGFIIDQELTTSFELSLTVDAVIAKLLSGLVLPGVIIEPTPYVAIGAYAVGSSRSQALDALTTQGDFFPYWMNHQGVFRMKRTKDPAILPVDFDLDTYKRIHRDSIAMTSDVLNAPNKFIVISNSSTTNTQAVVGSYTVPTTAPHSIANRGFVIQKSYTLQSNDNAQAGAMASSLGIRQTIYERVTFDTPNDPRHDSYNIIRWNGVNWLELAWSMELTAGGKMQHTARKSYL